MGRTMKFTCQVETSSSLNPVQPAAGKVKPGRNWDIQVRVDQVRLVSEPPANDVVEKLIFADQTTRASEPPPIFENQISTTAASQTSKKSSSQTSTTVSSKKSVSSRNV